MATENVHSDGNKEGQTELRRLILAIVKYSKDAPTHSELSTVHMLALNALEAYDSERK
jgi:hypothetical protein